jgi:hypothetical protein
MVNKEYIDVQIENSNLSKNPSVFPLDINDINNAGEYIIYTKSYVFLKRLNIECELDLQVIQNNTNSYPTTCRTTTHSIHNRQGL